MVASAQHNTPAVRHNDVVILADAAAVDDDGQTFSAHIVGRWTTASVVVVFGAVLVDKTIWSRRPRSSRDAGGGKRRQTPTLEGRSRADRAGENLENRDSSEKTVTRRRQG